MRTYDIANKERRRSIAMESIEENGYIDIDNIAVNKLSAGRNYSVNLWVKISKRKTCSSGMPCTTMLFTLVQHDRGNPE